MSNCIFCKIINQKIPADLIYKSKSFIVIKDLYPKAKIHLLIIPKKHMVFDDLTENQAQIIAESFQIAKKITKMLKIKNGFRLVINNGKNSGQEIEHLHIHYLAGQKLSFS
jgi:histidine triad (HIT) family protein